MTIIERHRAELLRAARFAMRRYGNVRDAAAYVGMSRSGFHTYAVNNGIPMGEPGPKKRPTRNASKRRSVGE